MTNTTKTLEETRNAFYEKYSGSIEDQIAFGEDLDSFAREIQNSTLDACRERIDKLDPMGNGIFTYEALEAIDSLRTGSGKE